MVAYFGMTQVCGQVTFELLATALGQRIGQIDGEGFIPDHAEHAV